MGYLFQSSNVEEARQSSAMAKKASNEEPAFKRPRIETPSPLPTFKVRKEKLGDRVTALQQLVSPFGKTDTASVLHEAIEYIKFLHDQVNVLSAPYLKNGCSVSQHHQQVEDYYDQEGRKAELRSRGLCLVPISSTFPVATETSSDFWTPTFGASFK
nr:transcription factor bHLH112-like [Ipomoea batatas]